MLRAFAVAALAEAEKADALALWSRVAAAEPSVPKAARAWVTTLGRSGQSAAQIAAVGAVQSVFPRLQWAQVLGDLLGQGGAAPAQAAGVPLRPRVVALLAAGRFEEASALLATVPEAEARAGWCVDAKAVLAGALGPAAEALADPRAALEREAMRVEEAGELDLAASHWAEMRTRFPDEPAGFAGGVRLAERRNRHDEADRLLVEAAGFFETTPSLVKAAFRSAARRQAWDEAVALGRRIRAAAPDDPATALWIAASLLGPRLGRADRVPQVLAHLVELHAAFPDFAPAYAAHVQVLREAGRSGEADEKAVLWRVRFPADPDLAIVRAAIAQETGDAAMAVDVLAVARALGASKARLEAAYGRALRLAGQDGEADAIVTAALARWATDADLLLEHVVQAGARGDWQAALARAEHAAAVCPAPQPMLTLAEQASESLVLLSGATADESGSMEDTQGPLGGRMRG